MPNHLHSLVFTKNETEEINFHIGETKRFMSYEIVSRLKKRNRIINHEDPKTLLFGSD